MSRSIELFTRGRMVPTLLVAAAMVALVVLVLNAGAFPQVRESGLFAGLQFIVAANTVVYAFLGSMKIGAKRTRRRRAPVRVD